MEQKYKHLELLGFVQLSKAFRHDILHTALELLCLMMSNYRVRHIFWPGNKGQLFPKFVIVNSKIIFAE